MISYDMYFPSKGNKNIYCYIFYQQIVSKNLKDKQIQAPILHEEIGELWLSAEANFLTKFSLKEVFEVIDTIGEFC